MSDPTGTPVREPSDDTAAVPRGGPDDRPAQSWILLVRILGVVLAGLVVTITTFVLVSSYFQRTIEETVVVSEPVDSIAGRLNRGSITLRVVQGESVVTLHVKRRYSFSRPEVTTAVSEGRLDIVTSCAEHQGSVFGTCAVDLEVTAPPGISLDLSTSDGDVELDAPDAPTRLTTASGSVRVSDATSDRVDISTAIGGVRLDFADVPDDVVVRTAAGSVAIRVPHDGTAYNVTGGTSLGHRSINVPLDVGSPHRIDASSSVGSVTLSSW